MTDDLEALGALRIERLLHEASVEGACAYWSVECMGQYVAAILAGSTGMWGSICPASSSWVDLSGLSS